MPEPSNVLKRGAHSDQCHRINDVPLCLKHKRENTNVNDLVWQKAQLLLAAGILLFGLFPRGLIDVARAAAQSLSTR